MGYTIRPMSLRDLPQVVSIERDSFPSPWSADYFRHEVTRNKISRYLVACEGNWVLGYIGVWLVVGEIHITTIAVDKAQRRKGIGESLLISVIELAYQHKARFLTLEVREANSPAWYLYAKYGFSEVGKRPRYYRDTDENAVIMTTEDIYSDSFQQLFQRLRQANTERSRGDY
ncbi:MAG: ribosomal protein S18-alanine N-acetyltransferase [Dehalococcoidia bacterium]